jgi:hypothetical protein
MKMPRICYKIHSIQGREVLAACDEQLVGKVLKEGELEFKVSEAFYHESKVSAEELKEMLIEHQNINLVGECAVRAAIEIGLASEECVKRINNVPHLQIYIID